MSIPSGVCRIVLSGALRGGENWQSGWWGTTTGSTHDDMDAIAASVVTTAEESTTESALLNMWDNQTSLLDVTVYGYPDGGPTATIMGGAALTGYVGMGPADLPNQACLVATLDTARSGRSYRGRMFIPATGMLLTNGQASSAATSALSAAIANLIHTDGDSGPGPIVLSQKLGTHQPVTSVTVDSVIDVQNRRRKNELATYKIRTTLS